jgi:hypothetical protein
VISFKNEMLVRQFYYLLKKFVLLIGSSDDLGRTYQYLIDALSSGANICLICIDIIQKQDAVRIKYNSLFSFTNLNSFIKIWNCSCCYSPFHIVCIQKWIKDGIYQSSTANNSPINTWHW